MGPVISGGLTEYFDFQTSTLVSVCNYVVYWILALYCFIILAAVWRICFCTGELHVLILDVHIREYAVVSKLSLALYFS